MGLYLCIFDGDDELEGVEVGAYEDFGKLRDYVARELESGSPGSRFPVLMLHSDCDGEWSRSDCEKLRAELRELEASLKALPPTAFASEWQAKLARSLGLVPENAFESFIDVDGEPVLARIQTLVERALACGLPILFQ